MSLASWFADLTRSGQVRVEPFAPLAAEEVQLLQSELPSLEREWREELAFAAPPLNPAAFTWAAVTAYRACQFLAYREIDETVVREVLAVPCPEAVGPSVCYSVDLCFRFLPDLIRLSRGVAEADPLVVGLHALGESWPLSSVGMKGISKVDVSAFIDQPALRQLYVDRIISAGDRSRLCDPRTESAVRKAIGDRFDLVGAELTKALRDVTAVKESSFND